MPKLKETSQEVNPNSEKKFLHLFWEFPPHILGGLGVAGKALCSALANQVKIDVALPVCQSPQPQAISNAVSDRKLTLFYIKMPQSISTLDAYSTQQKTIELSTTSFTKGVYDAHFTGYDAIHAHDWITADAGIALKQSNNAPLILHIHSTQVDRAGSQSKGTLFHKEQSAMLAADHIVTVSHFTKQTIIDHYHIPTEKITVIHNAAETLAGSTQTKPRPKNRPPTILFAGRLESQKSPLLALEIICRVLREHPTARAIIAGSGSLLSAVREIVKFKSLAHRIEVLGHVPQEKMNLIYQSSDLLIAPSASEPFGLVAVEAAQAGIPVVLSDHYGAAEILTSAPQLSLQDTTKWVKTAVHLLTNAEAREAQVKAQKTDILLHTWNDAAQQVLDIDCLI